MTLKQDPGLVWLTGELSILAMPSSGHWYFSLKDMSAQVLVQARARVSLYEPRGDCQLIFKSMQPAGDGVLTLSPSQTD